MENKNPIVTKEMFDSVKDMLLKMSRIHFTKIKKPTTITIDDIFQEGCAVLAKIVAEGKYNPKGKASLKTVLFRYFKWHCINMMKRSYKLHDPYTKCKLTHKDGTSIYRGNVSNELTYEDCDIVSRIIDQDIIDTIDSLKGLDGIDLEYIKHFVNTPPDITDTEKRNPMLFRKAVRSRLGITRDQEEDIRSKVGVVLGR